jgi:hypothetical protein
MSKQSNLNVFEIVQQLLYYPYAQFSDEENNARLEEAEKELLQLFHKYALQVIGDDEPDERKDAYSTTAIYKDYRNDLRKDQRQRLANLTTIDKGDEL